MTRRIVNVSVIPGELLDGSGRVCIHLFIQDEQGPFVEMHVLHPVYEDGKRVKQRLEVKPTRGRLVCSLTRTVAPITRGGVTKVTLRTDDPRAVTCLKCLATKECKEILEEVALTEQFGARDTRQEEIQDGSSVGTPN